MESYYKTEDGMKYRAFDFRLANEDQIRPSTDLFHGLGSQVGTTVRFKGLRIPSYQQHFTKRTDTFLRYFNSHFIADFLLGKGPKVTVSIDGDLTQYPHAVHDLVIGEPLQAVAFTVTEFGDFRLEAFACRPEASTGLEGNHQLHLLANGRTVESRKIDGLLGLETISHDGEVGLCFHACVAGEYLNERVNEGRTAFNIPEKTLKELTRIFVEEAKNQMLTEQMDTYKADRRRSFEAFVQRHPIYGFDETEALLDKVPFNATKAEEFASGLVKHQIRRDEKRQEAMESVIRTLDDAVDVPDSFADTV